MHEPHAFLFDLDGTLTDSVYQNVFAWKQALDAEHIPLAMWRIHRKIGMSGGLMLKNLCRETGLQLSDGQAKRLSERHADAYDALKHQITALPGAKDLLQTLTQEKIQWCIATSGEIATARINLAALGLDVDDVTLVTRNDVAQGKPDPGLFLAGAKKLDMAPERCWVVGDAIWDMLAARRARALSIGLLSGGYGAEELQGAGALRVYSDPLDLLGHLDEVVTLAP